MYILEGDDLLNYEYIIVYSEPLDSVKKAVSLQKGSFEINLAMLVNRGCPIHSIHKKLSNKKIHNIIKEVTKTNV